MNWNCSLSVIIMYIQSTEHTVCSRVVQYDTIISISQDIAVSRYLLKNFLNVFCNSCNESILFNVKAVYYIAADTFGVPDANTVTVLY